MLGVTCKPYLLSVIMLNVLMLKCPYAECRCAECRGAQINTYFASDLILSLIFLIYTQILILKRICYSRHKQNVQLCRYSCALIISYHKE